MFTFESFENFENRRKKIRNDKNDKKADDKGLKRVGYVEWTSVATAISPADIIDKDNRV